MFLQVINATILADDANSELSVKLLDCDSISQAKEKILDALYKVVKHPIHFTANIIYKAC